jgi:hypothetical protein
VIKRNVANHRARSRGRAQFLLLLSFTVWTMPASAQSRKSACHSGHYAFKGTVRKGESLSHRFGGFLFTLVPIEFGWTIDISRGSQHHLAHMTGPRHFVPNPIDIEGWHFRNAANTGRNKGDVNAPQRTRRFLFSPRWPHCEDAVGVDKDGQGILQITDMKLGNLEPGKKATILRMNFIVRLTVGRSACLSCPANTRQ